ncbi:hypothetical protein DPMN_018262 [Dreissena polymorpha]|uniref:G-protein coupled receptors family 1 profile domain-containing protein n=1 Tax=Dreissena polymorpha TaxID=45954 RepID=A0A9D4S679_DREPO|nr:hypothetical protein DPMN_018262 [Dreissena polymorpha]
MEGVRNGTTPTISMPLTVTLLIINIGAIVVNTPLVITIFALSNIRKNASYVHAVCLCLADLLASLTAIYKFLVLSGTVSCLDIDGCITVCRYLETVFAFTVILDIVAINIDKFYAIKFTIHYTNNATIVNSAVLHVIMFIVVAGISIIPIFTQNAQLNGVSLHAINYSNNSYVDECIVLVFFFVIPLVAMTLISVSIYLVARRSMMRVGPVGQFVCKEESERKSSESRRANTMHSVAQIDKNYQSKNNSMQAVNNGRPVIENEGSFCEYLSKVETECDERAHQEENNIKTLRSGLPTFTFLAVRSVTPVDRFKQIAGFSR